MAYNVSPFSRRIVFIYHAVYQSHIHTKSALLLYDSTLVFYFYSSCPSALPLHCPLRFDSEYPLKGSKDPILPQRIKSFFFIEDIQKNVPESLTAVSKEEALKHLECRAQPSREAPWREQYFECISFACLRQNPPQNFQSHFNVPRNPLVLMPQVVSINSLA